MLAERIFGRSPSAPHDVWALRDFNLQIGRGQVVGIVGRNGSGKSTLLQMIAGTLMPTTGALSVNGRVSAMLELGSGFNPEFTGRENVYLNGAIQGLSTQQIDGLFDRIAGFADIGAYMDEPIKTYSTGMVMRLAFAAAVATDPDILIVDEALAVGDEAFQRKCSARIADIRARGATILFVSHSSRQITELCDWAVLIDRGDKLMEGAPKIVIGAYQRLIYAAGDQMEAIRASYKALAPGQAPQFEPAPAARVEPVAPTAYDPALATATTIAYDSQGATISDLRIVTPAGEQANILSRGARYEIRYRVAFSQPAENVGAGTMIKTINGVELAGTSTVRTEADIGDVEAGAVLDVIWEFECRLLPGTYFLNAGTSAMVARERVFLHRILDGAMFRVQHEPGLHMEGFIDIAFNPRVVRLAPGTDERAA
ncbi:MAG: ABC transporter ATP-binding protein [Alphaproteobacteria bacterium]|nr:ABC transporter ATP-binding protein [Alphaproteobacteria bacterium]